MAAQNPNKSNTRWHGPAVVLSLPEQRPLKDYIQAEAKRHFRTLSGQIVAMLHDSMERASKESDDGK